MAEAVSLFKHKEVILFSSHRNPDFTIIVLILGSIGILSWVIVHFNMIS